MANAKVLPAYTNFLFASTAGMGATAVCFPLEFLKTRLQVIGEGERKHTSIRQVIKDIVRKEGVLGFYTGLSASLFRQATSTGVRMGAYQTLIDYFAQDGTPPHLLLKSACAIVSGVVGGIAGLPADVALTRMAADGNTPQEKRRNYKHIIDALVRIYKEEGLLVLFRGLTPSVTRAAIVNMAQLLGYAKAKEMLLKHNITGDNTYCHVISSLVSAFVSTICVLPADVAKTRIQNMRVINGIREYNGMVDAWIKIATREGIFALWKGFVPLLVRNGPQYIVFFVIYENLFFMYRYYFIEEGKT